MHRYLKFHKPYEVLSQFTDKGGRATLGEYIPIQGVYSIGRLDYRSEGLLLLTDDGKLSHILTDPFYSHPKTYWVQVEGVVEKLEVDKLQNEIVLPGLQTQLPQVNMISAPNIQPRSKPVRNYHPTTWLQIEIGEGKKHQIRRMTAAIGYPTLRLIRISIGKIWISDLIPGEWRNLTKDEIHYLKNIQ